MKNAIETSTSKWIKQKEESVNYQRRPLRLFNQRRTKEKTMKENEERLCDLCNTIEEIWKTWSLRREEMEKGTESLFKEIMMDTFPSFVYGERFVYPS